MEPMTHIRALYSDETKQYRFPMEPKAGDITEIRFRTGKDSADEVRLSTGDDGMLWRRWRRPDFLIIIR